MEAKSSTAAIQSQVLQTTLAEISSTRATATSEPGAGPDCCVICLDEVSESGTAQPCGHSNFDFICLANWLAVDAKCPLCKAAVLKVCYTDDAGNLKAYSVPEKAPPGRPISTSASASSIQQRTSSQATFQHYFLHRNNSRRPRYSHSRVTAAPPTPSAALLRRRQIYSQNLYSLHVGSNPVSRYRSGPTPSDFANDANLVSRARMFVRRELQVFSFLSDEQPTAAPSASTPTTTSCPSSSCPSSCSVTNGSRTKRANNAEFLLEYTVAILKTVDTQGAAGQAEEMLADFLGRDPAKLFLHELRAWLRSPCLSLEAWDRQVQYPENDAAGADRKRRRVEEGAGIRGGRVPRSGGWKEGDRTWKGDYWRPGHARSEDRRRRRIGRDGRAEVRE